MTNSISCPVCQNLCSTQAVSCPKCGHPFDNNKSIKNKGIIDPQWTEFAQNSYLIPPLGMIFSLLCFTMPFLKSPYIGSVSVSGIGLLFDKDGYSLLVAIFSSIAIIIISFKLKNKQGQIIVIILAAVGLLSILTVIHFSLLTMRHVSTFDLESDLEFGFGFYGASLGYIITLVSGLWNLQRNY
jgi:hypothetical protein